MKLIVSGPTFSATFFFESYISAVTAMLSASFQEMVKRSGSTEWELTRDRIPAKILPFQNIQYMKKEN